MHYHNNHGFIIPTTPTLRKSISGIPIDRWYIPIGGLHGHYLYSNGDISHSFNYNLTNHGYDWMYPTPSSALDAMILYREKAAQEALTLESSSISPFHPFFPSHPLEIQEHIEFLEPRPHANLLHKWVISNQLPNRQNVHIRYLHDDGQISHRSVLTINSKSTGLFDSKEDAQKALDAYRAKWNIPTTDVVSLPDDIVHKLLEPQMISDTFLLWEVISAENPNFALSDSNSIVHVAYRAQFDTFQSALFAKLRYERTHREIKTN